MSILIGIALSATCGFRVFVPLLAVNIGTRAKDADGQPLIELAAGFDWFMSCLEIRSSRLLLSDLERMSRKVVSRVRATVKRTY